MERKSLLFRGPVKSVSGYGAHSRDLLKSLYDMDMFDIKIDSTIWGSTPLNALNENNSFHKWILDNIVTFIDKRPDIFIQVTIPNEFQRVGTINIGVTAGIETTVAPKEWIEGCNRMDLIIATSNFSRDILLSTVYNETDNITGKLIKQFRVTKPISVLFEGVNLEKFNNHYRNFDLQIDNDFIFLFVGHWLQGDIGQDRKDVGMLIKTFCETYKDVESPPALLLKTSSSTFSVNDRENIIGKIKNVTKGISNPPPVYLIFGDLDEDNMNQLYNHPNVKCMITITKGEGFCRPLLEFSMTGKPIIASNWSGHKDFLPMDKAIMVGGKVMPVHESAVNNFIIKGSSWFTANYNEVSLAMKYMKENYDELLIKSEELRKENIEKFSLNKMTEIFKNILVNAIESPKERKIVLPKLNKLNNENF